jgi:putative transcriptional regulator
MKPKPTSDGSLAGKVLAAQPHLMDPHFRQSLVYMVEHDHNGALGLVMNRPMGRNFGEVARHPEIAEALAEVPVYMGGPVKPESLLVAMFKPGKTDDSVQCALTSGLDELRRFQMRRKGWVRAFAGYAGWTEGQLERELEEGAWKICPFSQHMMDERLVQGLWPFYIVGDTRWHKLLGHMPQKPELN